MAVKEYPARAAEVTSGELLEAGLESLQKSLEKLKLWSSRGPSKSLGPWGVGQISVGFRSGDRRPLSCGFSQIAEDEMLESSLKLDDALTALDLALFTFRDHNHPSVFLLLKSAFFEETNRRMISGICGCRQLLQPHACPVQFL